MTPARDPRQPILFAFRQFFSRGSGPRGLGMAATFTGVDSQGLANILDPLRTVFADLEAD